MGIDQTTTPGTPCPTLYDECVGSLTTLTDHNSEDAGDGAYGLSSLSVFCWSKFTEARFKCPKFSPK